MKRAGDSASVNGDVDTSPAPKKAKLDPQSTDSIEASFAPSLFAPSTFSSHKSTYDSSSPWNHGVIQPLISDNLLRSVRDEIKTHISFTLKETDIYRIHQSGDLANLDGLESSDLKDKLPSLLQLRNALYSQEFREFIGGVTGMGKLSGRKTDMAINIYTPGSHLLCHDDVIGTRRVSYILYLIDPDEAWPESWGGALRLYALEDHDVNGTNVPLPGAEPVKSIPIAWNQLSFFGVQPGESYHDVEEVYSSGDAEQDEKRVRMAISGWFHIPQEGEDGFGEETEVKGKSSLEQLTALDGSGAGLPNEKATEFEEQQETDEEEILSEQEIDFLLKYLHPRYLVPDTLDEISADFSADAVIVLESFLNDKYAASVQEHIINGSNGGAKGWKTAMPPHRHRYLYLPSSEASSAEESPVADLAKSLFPSSAFRKWIQITTGMVLQNHNIRARRFRRGNDYQLATGYTDEEPRLELTLGITPFEWVEVKEEAEQVNGKGKGKGKAAAVEEEEDEDEELSPLEKAMQEEAQHGGYETYMAPEDDDEEEEEDEAAGEGNGESSSAKTKGKSKVKADPAVYQSKKSKGKAADTQDEEDEEDDESTLFSFPSCWNRLAIVLRDQGTMRFVKYVTKQAKRDRWDITGEYAVDWETSRNVGLDDDEEGEGEDGDEGEDGEDGEEDDEDDELEEDE